MKKRFVSVILALCMVLGMVPLKAFAAESGAFAEPKVTQLTFSYDGGKPVDLLGNQPTISMPAGSKPVFTVTFDSTELLNKVFVTSTKDGETKYLEATLQDGKYVTDSYFDPNDTSYIPGTIAVTYSKKTLKIDESGNIGGTDLNTLKTQLTAQGVSSRNEATGAGGTVTAEIVLGDTFGTMANVYFDAAVSEFTVGAGVDQSELNKWLGVYQNLSQLSSYDLKDANGKQFTLYLGDGKDFSDPDTYLMLVKDATSNKYTKMLLSKAADKAGLGDISDSLASANVVTKKLLEYNAISKDTATLREEIEAHPTMTAQEKAAVNAKIDALDRDKKLFLIGMTAISLLTAPAGTPLMISALAAGYTSIADYFWDYRVGLIQGCESVEVNCNFTGWGDWDKTITATLDSVGTLTFRGTGTLYGYLVYHTATAFGKADSRDTATLKRIVVGDGITVISSSAFDYAFKKDSFSVTLPGGIKQIEKYAFHASGLQQINLPNSITEIATLAFWNCANLEHITLPSQIAEIKESTFEGCTGLTSIVIPGNVLAIGKNAFLDCTALRDLTINDGVSNIDEGAFNGCTSISSITIPGSVKTIGNMAFYRCTAPKITISNGVKSIGENAFSGNKNLTSITIPNTVTAIGLNAFGQCTNIKDIYFEGTEQQWNSIPNIQDAFFDYSEITLHFNSIEENQNQVTVTPSTGGNVTFTPSEPADGDTVTITVTPDSGYQGGTPVVKDSSGNTISVTDVGNGKYTFTKPAGQVTITAPEFTRPTYSVTAPSSIPNGSVTVSVVTVHEGDTVTITVTPNAGYQGGSPVVKDADGNTLTITDAGNGKYTFVMPAKNVVVTASEFTPMSYTITGPSKPSNGTVSLSAATAHKGDTVTITVTPDINFAANTPVVTGPSGSVAVAKVNDTTYTFVMPEGNVTVTASFSVINFTLAYTPYASMTDADKKLYYGGKLEITGLVPNTKYVVTFDNGLAAPKQVNGRNVIPRIAHVVTSDAAGKVALGCQDSMNVMVFGVSSGGNVTTDLVELYAKNHAGVPVSGLASKGSGT